MPNLTITGTITRTELALADLAFQDAGVYQVVSAGPGALGWRREVATSPYVHGETLVSAVKDVGRAPLVVRALGTSASQLDTRIAALVRAFEQFSYSITLTIDGVVKTWTCEPADYAPGDSGTLDKFGLMAKMQEIHFDIPRHPVPVAGSM